MNINRTIIAKGQRVTRFSRFGDKDGIIYAIDGEQKPEEIKQVGGFMRYPDPCRFQIVFEDGTIDRACSEINIRDPKNYLIREEFATDFEIAAALRKVRQIEEQKEAESARKAEALQQEKQKLIAENPDLTRVSNDEPARLTAAKNIRRELKKAFPNIKFSVTSKQYTGGNSIDVRWTDGPTVRQVEAITGKYSGGSFNGMDDSYTYRSTAWTSLFGDAKYVSESRSISDEFRALALAWVAATYVEIDGQPVDELSARCNNTVSSKIHQFTCEHEFNPLPLRRVHTNISYIESWTSPEQRAGYDAAKAAKQAEQEQEDRSEGPEVDDAPPVPDFANTPIDPESVEETAPEVVPVQFKTIKDSAGLNLPEPFLTWLAEMILNHGDKRFGFDIDKDLNATVYGSGAAFLNVMAVWKEYNTTTEG